VSDSIKGFSEIESDYNNIRLFSEEVGKFLESAEFVLNSPVKGQPVRLQ